MRKKWFTLCCVGMILAFAAVGCGSGNSGSDSENSDSGSEEMIVNDIIEEGGDNSEGEEEVPAAGGEEQETQDGEQGEITDREAP